MAVKPRRTLKNTQASTKRMAIDKARAKTLIAMSIAAFVIVFCLVASKAVLSQNEYQARVTTAKEKAHQQLLKNISAFNSLVSNYHAFDTAPTNVIGGTASGTGNNDGTNSKIILDALPYTYDFPALTSSIEKILNNKGLKIAGLTGTDEQVAQQSNASSPSPQPVSIPFGFSISNANYASIQQLITVLQGSIRPISIDALDLSGSMNSMNLTVTAHTHYQPAKSLNITKTAVQ